MSRFRYSKDHLTEAHYTAFFSDLEQRTWQESMDRLLARNDIAKPQKIPQFLADRRRNDFIYLLPITPEATVLDFGSGWGNTSFTLAQTCKRVVAMEADANRLRFSSEHLRHNGCDNVFPLAAGSAQFLPFADETFDAVIMNGVLEWTATATHGDPGRVHRRVLAEILRVLNPGGSLLVSIENRYSYKFLTGMRDHHAGGLRWVTMLPRWLANLYSLLRLGRSYRTWFYGYEALRNLVTEAGFTIPDFYSYHPNHVTYTHLFRIDNDENARRFMHELHATLPLTRRDRLVYRLCDGVVPFRKIAHDFMFITRKPGKCATNPLTEVAMRVVNANRLDDVAFNLRSTARFVLLEAIVDGKPRALIKFPREDSGAINLAQETACLRRLGEVVLPAGDVGHPSFIEAGTALGRPFLAMSHVAGMANGDAAETGIRRQVVTDWLIALARASASDPVDGDFVNRWQAAARSAVPDVSGRMGSCASVAAQRATGLRRVLVHGDLSPNNILNDGKRIAVIDWEFGRVEGFPLTDLIDFLLYGIYRRTRDYRSAWHTLFHESAGAEMREYLRQYCKALDLEETHVGPLALMFILGKLTLLGPLPEPISARKRSQLLDVLDSTDFSNLVVE